MVISLTITLPLALRKVLYVSSRLTPVLIFCLINLNPYHNFYITLCAEFFMSLDDIGLITYKTSKILGGAIFMLEKLLSYGSYMEFGHIIPLIIGVCTYSMLRYVYPRSDFTNLLYMAITANWLIKIACLFMSQTVALVTLLGAIIYFITDFDVAMYDCRIFGVCLLPAYYAGLYMLTY